MLITIESIYIFDKIFIVAKFAMQISSNDSFWLIKLCSDCDAKFLAQYLCLMIPTIGVQNDLKTKVLVKFGEKNISLKFNSRN